MLRDQQTILIGGLIREDLQTEKSKTPSLGDLPVVRHLFRSKGVTDSRSELVLFLTPMIVDEADKLQEFSDQMTALFSRQRSGGGRTGDSAR